jgi:hypothetical protein
MNEQNPLASQSPRETTWQNTLRKLPTAVLAFLLGALIASLGMGGEMGRAYQATTECRAQLSELQGTATVLLGPTSIDVAHGAIGLTSPALPLAPEWIVPAKIMPQSVSAGRAYLWIGKSGTPQGPFAASIAVPGRNGSFGPAPAK